MPKKLTITVSDRVYVDLHRNVGRKNIDRFVDRVLGPRVAGGSRSCLSREPTDHEIARGYAEIAADEANNAREIEEADEAWLQEMIATGRGPTNQADG